MLVFRIVLLVSLFFAGDVFAQEDGAYLDPQYTNHSHPKHVRKTGKQNNFDLQTALKTSNTKSMIGKQSAVKSQGSRGTCSIFSAMAMLEAMLVKEAGVPTSIDLSEEWLEYLIMRRRASEGSTSYSNFSTLLRWGAPEEMLMPYIGETWETVFHGPLSEQRCGHLVEDTFEQRACLLGHRDPALLDLSDAKLSSVDPELLSARQGAASLRQEYIKSSSNSYFTVNEIEKIKSLLVKGTPLTLDIDFYYGAWNHRKAETLGIPRNLTHWDQGIVGYPLRGSVDVVQTQTDPAGHSVLIVGYDDTVEVQLEHLMPNGTTIKKSYKGVYYFKNSWGTLNFGVQFTLDGASYPGYGMIVQDYAHDYGTFFQLPL